MKPNTEQEVEPEVRHAPLSVREQAVLTFKLLLGGAGLLGALAALEWMVTE